MFNNTYKDDAFKVVEWDRGKKEENRSRYICNTSLIDLRLEEDDSSYETYKLGNKQCTKRKKNSLELIVLARLDGIL